MKRSIPKACAASRDIGMIRDVIGVGVLEVLCGIACVTAPWSRGELCREGAVLSFEPVGDKVMQRYVKYMPLR